MSLDAARRLCAATLREAGISGGDLDARLLVGAACGLDHAGLIREGDRALGEEAGDRLAAFVRRRIAHEPVSRILGRREFWGLPFAIGPDVLDPRADTEAVVATVLDALADRRREPLRLLDLGTGSGAILAALLHELPGAFGVGIERSAAACRVAVANLGALGLDARGAVVRASWTDALTGPFDAIVSNPPYIATAEIAGLAADVRDHDPRGALDGGRDGLDAYRALAPRLDGLLAPGGIAALECGWEQGEIVAGLLRAHGLRDVVVVSDLAGHGRVATGRASDRPSVVRRSPLRKLLGERNENA